MQIRIYKDGEQRGPYTEQEVARFIKNGAYDKHDLGFTDRYGKWLPLSELLNPSAGLEAASAKSSAVKAGWICLAIAFCTFWIFGIGFVFFSVTMVLAVVAMCTHQINQGIALLVSAILGLAVCWVISFFLIVGTTAVAFNKATQRIQKMPQSPIQMAVPSSFQYSASPSRPQTIQPIAFTPTKLQGRFIKPADVLNSQEALIASDVLLMVRSGMLQNEIIISVHQRGLVKPIIGSDAAGLQQQGASSSLITAVEDYNYVLTPEEYQRYLSRQARRNPNPFQSLSSQSNTAQQPPLDDAERRRLQSLQDQQMANASQSQREQQAKKDKMDQQMKFDEAKRNFINQNHVSPAGAEIIRNW